MADELKPCPFCGSDAILTSNPSECGCDKCEFWFHGECDEEAINAWNTRSGEPK